MPRPLNPNPSPQRLYPVTCYFKSSREAMIARIRCRELGKTMSGYIRDLIMEDVIKNSKKTKDGGFLYDPFNNTPTEPLAPPVEALEDIVFFTQEDMDKKKAEEEAEEQKIQDILKDI